MPTKLCSIAGLLRGDTLRRGVFIFGVVESLAFLGLAIVDDFLGVIGASGRGVLGFFNALELSEDTYPSFKVIKEVVSLYLIITRS